MKQIHFLQNGTSISLNETRRSRKEKVVTKTSLPAVKSANKGNESNWLVLPGFFLLAVVYIAYKRRRARPKKCSILQPNKVPDPVALNHERSQLRRNQEQNQPKASVGIQSKPSVVIKPRISDKPALNQDQQRALEILKGTQNVFLTGSAGTGKSHLINYFHSQVRASRFPIVASTGAAAVLVKGRTFHSFFGLGIMAGGVHATVEKAIRSVRVRSRLEDIDGVIIDEVSMLSGTLLSVAEQIARRVRGNSTPWGGLKVIAVGDFYQLPPVTRSTEKRDWVFRHPVWTESEFRTVSLSEVMRTRNKEFLDAIN